MAIPDLVIDSQPVLRPAFLTAVKQEAKLFNAGRKAASRHQWALARMVNLEWAYVNDKFEGEINKAHFYAAISHEINAVLPFPICSDSGETLRRWCEVAASYQNADTDELENLLSFDHFRVARSLAKLPANDAKNLSPMAILRKAAKEKWTVEDMKFHYGDRDSDDPIDRVRTWLENLKNNKFEWIKNKADREEIEALVARIARIIDQNVAGKPL
jgi:hypothetical protein